MLTFLGSRAIVVRATRSHHSRSIPPAAWRARYGSASPASASLCCARCLRPREDRPAPGARSSPVGVKPASRREGRGPRRSRVAPQRMTNGIEVHTFRHTLHQHLPGLAQQRPGAGQHPQANQLHGSSAGAEQGEQCKPSRTYSAGCWRWSWAEPRWAVCNRARGALLA